MHGPILNGCPVHVRSSQHQALLESVFMLRTTCLSTHFGHKAAARLLMTGNPVQVLEETGFDIRPTAHNDEGYYIERSIQVRPATA